MDDNIFDGEDIPALGPKQVYAAKYVITVVNFPSPRHVDAFGKLITALVQKVSGALGVLLTESAVSLGIAEKVETDDKPPSIDLNNFRN